MRPPPREPQTKDEKLPDDLDGDDLLSILADGDDLSDMNEMRSSSINLDLAQESQEGLDSDTCNEKVGAAATAPGMMINSPLIDKTTRSSDTSSEQVEAAAAGMMISTPLIAEVASRAKAPSGKKKKSSGSSTPTESFAYITTDQLNKHDVLCGRRKYRNQNTQHRDLVGRGCQEKGGCWWMVCGRCSESSWSKAPPPSPEDFAWPAPA